MSDEYDRMQVGPAAAAQHKPGEFQEAPGEAEANVMRDTFLQNAGPSATSQAAALSRADGGMRAAAVSRLQEDRGNSYVQRVVAESRGAPSRLVGMSQPDMVSEVVQRKGSGDPLPDNARQQLEPHFGADLSGVRVHTDGEAGKLNSELDAQAFTVGNDIFFSEGKYNPGSSEGQGLLAHELTHVGQQTGFGGGAAVQREAAAPEEDEAKKSEAGPAAGKKPEEEMASA